jgi:hypothetical protein
METRYLTEQELKERGGLMLMASPVFIGSEDEVKAYITAAASGGLNCSQQAIHKTATARKDQTEMSENADKKLADTITQIRRDRKIKGLSCDINTILSEINQNHPELIRAYVASFEVE